MSFLATRTSAVGNSGAAATGAGFLSEPLARKAAMPPAPIAIARTTIRAVFIRFYSYMTQRRCRRRSDSSQIEVKARLRKRIEVALAGRWSGPATDGPNMGRVPGVAA